MSSRTLYVGAWTVEPSLNRLARDDLERWIEIEPKAMDLLVFLAERAGEVLSTEELIAAVWTGRIVGDHAVYRLVQQLRRALGDDASNPTYIATVPRRGYRLIAPVTGLSEPHDQLEQAGYVPRSVIEHRTSRTAAVLITVAVLLVAALLVWRLAPVPPGFSGTPTIAVLPFINLSEDERNDYLGEGIAGEIIHALSNGSGLRVVARTSAFTFQDSDLLIADIADRLGASLVLEGTVRRENGRLRIISQLVDAATGEQLWSRDFDRYVADLISVERDIALEITTAIVGQNADTARVAAALPPVPNISAYEYYLLGRQRMYVPSGVGRDWSHADADQAIEYFRSSIAADPTFARAFAGLADAMLRRAIIGRGIYDAEPIARKDAAEIVAAIERAEELDPGLAETRLSRGLALRILEGDHRRAFDLYREAIELNPNLVDAYVSLARGVQGEEGIAALETAVLLDPLSPDIHVWLVRLLKDLFRFEEAHGYMERAFELEYFPLSIAALHALDLGHAGQLDAAVREFLPLLERPEYQDSVDAIHVWLGLLYIDLEDFRRAEASRDAVTALGEGATRATALPPWLALARNDTAEAAALIHRSEPSQINGLLEMLIGHDDHAREQISGDEIDGNEIDDYVAFGFHPAVNDAHLRLRQGDAANAARLLNAAQWDVEMAISDEFLDGGANYIAASIHALENDAVAALDSLEAAFDAGWRRAWYAEIDPNLAIIRNEPRFQALMTEVRADLARQRAAL